MPNIREIAKLAGVSTGTVSNVLNHPDKVNPATREKVYETLKQTNIQISKLPMNNKRVTNTIGLIISNIDNPLYPPIIKAVEEVLDESGYSLMLCNTEKSIKKELRYVQIMEERNVDGVIIMSSSGISNCNHIYKLKGNGIPVVLINRSTEDHTIRQVMLDTFNGGYSATEHLINLNHKRIAFFSRHRDGSVDNAFMLRYKGYHWALEHHNIPYDKEIVFEKDGDSFQAGFELAEEMTNKFSNNLPTAVFIANDAMAMGAIKYFKKKGISVPDDISVVGFNNNFFASYGEPALTTVDFPIIEAGKIAAKNIIEEINGIQPKLNQQILSCGLIIRESTKRI